MNCGEFTQVLADVARERSPLPGRAEQHAAGCPECAARLDAERLLAAALHALREEAWAATPAATEERLMAAFRQKHAAPETRFRRRRLMAAAAAIAASVAIAVALWSPRRAVPAPVIARRVAPENAAPETPMRPPAEPRVVPMKRASAAKLRAEAQPVPARAVAAEPASGMDFVPLPYAPPLQESDGAQVIRVRLPRESMRTVGLPVNEDRAWERIQADVLMGQDGIARAIRFVR